MNAQTPTPRPLHLNTLDLKIGDVVTFYGMRVKLDRAPRVFTALCQGGRTVYAWDGLVLNREEIPGTVIPMSWTRLDGIGNPYPDGEHRWTVQGNDMATWSVTREG